MKQCAKRWLASILALIMLMTVYPMNAFAIKTEDMPEQPVLTCICEAKCTDEQVDESCPVCANDLTGCIGDPVQESGEDDRKEPELPSQPSVDDGDNAENTQTSPQPPVNQPNDVSEGETPENSTEPEDNQDSQAVKEFLGLAAQLPEEITAENAEEYQDLLDDCAQAWEALTEAEQEREDVQAAYSCWENVQQQMDSVMVGKLGETTGVITWVAEGGTISSSQYQYVMDALKDLNKAGGGILYVSGEVQYSQSMHSSMNIDTEIIIIPAESSTARITKLANLKISAGGKVQLGKKGLADQALTIECETGYQRYGISVIDGGELLLDDGICITQEPNRTEKTSDDHYYSPLFAKAGGQITMNGGEISGNKWVWRGGAMTLEENSQFVMNGGKICDNSVCSMGGGIFVGSTCMLQADGGIIEKNQSQAGAGIYSEGSLKILGSTKIQENFAPQTNARGIGILVGKGVLNIEGSVEISNNKIDFGDSKSANARGVGICINKGANATITGASIIGNGWTGTPYKTSQIVGGGIYNEGNLQLKNCVISENKVFGSSSHFGYGGGIYSSGTCKVEDTTFQKNDASSAMHGGAICARDVTLERCTFIENTAQSGGAVYISATGLVGSDREDKDTIINACKFQKNTALQGGAIYLDERTKYRRNITNCEIIENSSNGSGGGIAIDQGQQRDSIGTKIEHCTISRNHAENGGGIHAFYATQINDCTIDANVADYGGGVYIGAGGMIAGCKLFKNEAKKCGGGLYLGNFVGATLKAYVRQDGTIVRNQIFENSATQGGGIYIMGSYGDEISLSDTDLVKNRAEQEGGGLCIYPQGGNTFKSNVSLQNGRVEGNISQLGGGIYLSGAAYQSFTMNISREVVVGNVAENGGGIYVIPQNDKQKITMIMENAALFGNTAGNETEGNRTTTSSGADLYAADSASFQIPTVADMKTYLSDPTHTEVTDADRAVILDDDWYYDYMQNDSGAPSESTEVDRYQNGYKVIYNDANTLDTGYVPLIVGVTPTYSLSYRYSGEVPENAPALPDTASKKLEGDPVEVVAAPPMKGYTFSGWTVAEPATGTIIVNGTVTMPAANVVLEGFWTKNPVYTLTYDANFEGGGQKTPDAACEAGTVLTIQGEKLFTRGEDYTLIDWNTDPNGGGTTYDFGESFTVPKDNTTLYAQWKRNYTLTYISNGGSSVESEQYLENETAQVDEEPEREGYTFEGWYADEALMIPVTEVEMTSDKYVYAKWKKISDGGASHPEYTPDDDDENTDRDDEDDTEEFTDEEVPLAETPWLNTEDHYAYIIGYSEDGTVRPNANITRAEVATIFFRLLTDEARDQFWSTSNNFTDVASDAWYNNAVSTMVNAGIIQGYEDGTFRPNNNITRAEFAAIASRFMSAGYDVEEDLFTDIANHWARESINDAAMAKWINGYPDGTFLPDKEITRAEAVTLVNNVLQRKPDADHMLDTMIKWPDNMDTSAWYYEAIQEATNSHDYDLFEGAQYETWTALQENRDWAALEKDWLNAHRTGGEVM
ncbi:S-layer homology domain-containing protein [Butyricicoccus pullicaecorum]|uniref:SLH domain-containing protein n=1 Tax=Butyricicoccus pullicaecorum 1.2 TaxID=1203606 RepID=R8VUG2_9FIRM|nr:S-layer homology domain-containing protein [Butyricicoccus pullicaecorum]EOQ36193.1 hypothetical protein HMPREF1526_02225 [Butyricicoccus pullicaecorum 1.2]SKA59644.1 Listeria/Bacterioides repeat-containing protein [Butyricicoccus pullicaecorum DSM 23266]